MAAQAGQRGPLLELGTRLLDRPDAVHGSCRTHLLAEPARRFRMAAVEERDLAGAIHRIRVLRVLLRPGGRRARCTLVVAREAPQVLLSIAERDDRLAAVEQRLRIALPKPRDRRRAIVCLERGERGQQGDRERAGAVAREAVGIDLRELCRHLVERLPRAAGEDEVAPMRPSGAPAVMTGHAVDLAEERDEADIRARAAHAAGERSHVQPDRTRMRHARRDRPFRVLLESRFSPSSWAIFMSREL